MKKPSARTIRRRLKELRSQIDATRDPVLIRISYAMECAIRWAIEETHGWEPPAESARHLAKLLHSDLSK